MELDEHAHRLRFLTRDRDAKFTAAFDTVFAAAGVSFVCLRAVAASAGAINTAPVRAGIGRMLVLAPDRQIASCPRVRKTQDRLGRVRALVSAGYLTMPFAKTAAAENFTEALVLAEHFGDRLFLANAQLGLAEFRQRQRDRTTAQDHAQRALAQF